MKLLPAAASTLLLIKGAASQECPNSINLEEWVEKTFTQNGNELTFRYAVVLATSPNEQSILCGRLESDMESFIGLGISPDGTMEGGEAIIGLPDDGTVKKYTLGLNPRVDAMPAEKQTLMYTDIKQEDGKTVMEFAKHLVEDGEHEILVNEDNVFLYAVGTNNELGYHSARGDFTVYLEPAPKPSTSTTSAPTTLVSAGSSSGGNGVNEVVPGIQRTISPTPGAPPRGPAPAPTPETGAPQTGAPASGDKTVDVGASASGDETVDAGASTATEPDSAETESGAMARQIAGSMILGAGIIAMWFGV